MAKKQLFESAAVDLTTNDAGGAAYKLSAKTALTTYALTGVIEDGFYASADTQLERVKEWAAEVNPEYIAKLAVYSRKKGYMKDMPAVLLAVLATKSSVWLERAFPKVCDNPKVLRNFVKFIRSGQFGRKSLGTAPKRCVQNWFTEKTPLQLWRSSIGNDPSLADCMKLSHPRPKDVHQEAMFKYLAKKDCNSDLLPEEVNAFRFTGSESSPSLPEAPFEMLMGLPLTKDQWVALARQCTWSQLRQNLSNFAKHGVFEDPAVEKEICSRLGSKEEVARSKVFPYQLYTTYKHITGAGFTPPLRNAVQDALDTATYNVPGLPGRVVVAVDVSGSMRDPVTGNRGSATSTMSCVEVAALIAACVLRKNPEATIIPFDTQNHLNHKLNPRDSVVSNATMLAGYGGGGTACSLPVKYLNDRKESVDVIYMISDNMSWADMNWAGYGGNSKPMLSAEWEIIRRRNPKAKLVLHDINASGTSQIRDKSPNTLLVSGFSDTVFDVVAGFASGDINSLTDAVEAVRL